MTYRSLSLDGGGPWALLQAMALERLYPGLDGHAILSRFDLAVANSGGSITLAGLVKGLRPAEITALFRSEAQRRRIFVRRNAVEAILDDPAAKWDAEGKRAGLRAIIDEDLVDPLSGRGLSDAANAIRRSAGQAAPRLMIAAFDVDRNRARFFRSFQSVLATEDPAFEPTLADAVHASTHAPVFFFADCATVADRNRPDDRRRFWDGALSGANNPVLAGVIEAIAEGHRDIAALSLGTGSVWRPVAPARAARAAALVADTASLTLLDGVRRLAGAILDDPPDSATVSADVLTALPGEQRMVRINPMVRPVRNAAGLWDVPDGYGDIRPGNPVAAFAEIANLPMDAVEDAQVALIAALGQAWLRDRIPNQPLRWNPTDGREITGHIAFSAALARWRQIDPWRPAM